jgi:hypothetical protein
MPLPILITPTQMRRIRPHIPLSNRALPVDDGLCSASSCSSSRAAHATATPRYDLYRTLYKRFVREGAALGVFSRIFAALAGNAGALDRCMGRTKVELEPRLPAVCDGHGRPVVIMLSAEPMTDQTVTNILSRCARRLAY